MHTTLNLHIRKRAFDDAQNAHFFLRQKQYHPPTHHKPWKSQCAKKLKRQLNRQVAKNENDLCDNITKPKARPKKMLRMFLALAKSSLSFDP